MKKQRTKLYLVFFIAFIVLHYTGGKLMQFPYLTNAIGTFAAVLATTMMLRKLLWKEGIRSTLRVLGFGKTDIPAIVPGIVVSVVLIGAYPLLGWLLDANIVLADNWLANAKGLVLTAGFAEEMLFRGLLFGQLRKEMPFTRAIALSTVAFAAAHLLLFTYMEWRIALMSTLLAIGISLPLAHLYERGKHTIWSPALVHISIRTIGLVVITTADKSLRLTGAWMLLSLVIPWVPVISSKLIGRYRLNKKQKTITT